MVSYSYRPHLGVYLLCKGGSYVQDIVQHHIQWCTQIGQHMLIIEVGTEFTSCVTKKRKVKNSFLCNLSQNTGPFINEYWTRC